VEECHIPGEPKILIVDEMDRSANDFPSRENLKNHGFKPPLERQTVRVKKYEDR
jgi:hypothetical protein